MPDLKVSTEIESLFDEAESSHKEVRDRGFSWDGREDLFYGRYKNSKEQTQSVYSTGELQAMVFDSSCRVMGQMASGRFTSVADENILNVIAANLVYHQYMIPNANKGGDFFTKMRMANFYSKVYGTMPTFIEPIATDKYQGTDAVLIHPRRFKPEPGKYVIEDMDYCFAETTVTKKWLEDKHKAAPNIWKSVGQVTESELPQASMTTEERAQTKNKKIVVLRHYFTTDGDWTIWDAQSKTLIVEEKGFFPKGCLPFVDKQTIPLLDRYWGWSEYERGETPQKAIDTMTRLFLDSWRLGIEPPLVFDPEKVVVSSIVRQPSADWLVKEGGSITPARLNFDGMGQFGSAYQIVKANLLSLSAQTDTSISKSTDVGFGKTPEALRQQAQREGARDSWDRYMQERYLEKVANKMMQIAAHRGFDKVSIKNIGPALEKLKKAYPDQDLSIFEKGTIGKEYLSGDFGRYEVDPGSTMKRDDSLQKMYALLIEITKNPKIAEAIRLDGKKVNWGEAIKRMAIDNGIQDWDKIIVDAENPESVEGVGDTGATIEGDGMATTDEVAPLEGVVSTEAPAAVTPEQIASIAKTI